MKRKKKAKPKASMAKARVALTARVSRRCFLFTGTRLDQGETKRKDFFGFFLRGDKKAGFVGDFWCFGFQRLG